jgi:hypothetical protein
LSKVEESDEAGRMRAPRDCFTIWADARITRRKYYHLISDPEGEIVFHAKLLGACLDWLAERDVSRYRFCTEHWTLMLRVTSSRRLEELT